MESLVLIALLMLPFNTLLRAVNVASGCLQYFYTRGKHTWIVIHVAYYPCGLLSTKHTIVACKPHFISVSCRLLSILRFCIIFN